VEPTGESCPVCHLAVAGFDDLAQHFMAEADGSDIAHVMWLNRNVTKFQVPAAELALLLRRRAEGRPMGIDRVTR
jgi:hypothetical protein